MSVSVDSGKPSPGAVAATQLCGMLSWLAAAALAYTVLLTNHCAVASLSCLDHYWVEHWLIGYGDGFTRRGLLGFLHQQLLGSTVNLLALNLAALGVLVLLGWIVVTFLRRSGLHPLGLRAFLLVVAITPISGVLVETLGDPLQICLALTALALAAISVGGTCPIGGIGWWGPRGALVAVVVLLMALIHEASLLLCAPGFLVVLAAPARSGYWRRLLLAGLAVALALGLLLAALRPLSSPPGEERARSAAAALIARHPLTRETIDYSGSQSEAFESLLRSSLGEATASRRQAWLALIKPVRTGLIPLLALLSFGVCSRGAIPVRLVWRVWISLAIFSIPLLLIAVDWGRFAVHTFVITLLVTLSECHRDRRRLATPGEASEAAGAEPSLGPLWWSIPLLTVVVSLMASPLVDGYRIHGVPLRSLYALAVALLLLLPSWLRWQGLLGVALSGTRTVPPSLPRS